LTKGGIVRARSATGQLYPGNRRAYKRAMGMFGFIILRIINPAL